MDRNKAHRGLVRRRASLLGLALAGILLAGCQSSRCGRRACTPCSPRYQAQDARLRPCWTGSCDVVGCIGNDPPDPDWLAEHNGPVTDTIEMQLNFIKAAVTAAKNDGDLEAKACEKAVHAACDCLRDTPSNKIRTKGYIESAWLKASGLQPPGTWYSVRNDLNAADG
jgi:hypothetical protein